MKDVRTYGGGQRPAYGGGMAAWAWVATAAVAATMAEAMVPQVAAMVWEEALAAAAATVTQADPPVQTAGGKVVAHRHMVSRTGHLSTLFLCFRLFGVMLRLRLLPEQLGIR